MGTLLDDVTADEITRRKKRASHVGDLYAEAVELRNNAFSLKVLDAKSERQMGELKNQLLVEMRDLAPEQSITLETINVFHESDQPPCLLQELDRPRAMGFSEFLRRVMGILGDYK